MFDCIKVMAKDYLEWKIIEFFKSVFVGDMKGVMVMGKEGVLMFFFIVYVGMMVEEFK